MGTDARKLVPAVLLALGVGSGCSDATDIALLEIPDSAVLFGQAYLDLDRSGSITAADSAFDQAEVILTSANGSSEVTRAMTDSLGTFRMDDVPAGTFRLVVDPSFLGDSLVAVSTVGTITVEATDTAQIDIGVSFEELTIEEVLLAPPGRKVFTSGIALNSRINFGDGQVHFESDGSYLRGISVARSGLAPGDSVRVLGRTVVNNGRPALTMVLPTVLVGAAVLVQPEDVSTAEAAEALGGPLDAALVRIRNAEITDTSTNAAGHFRFWADDGTDSVEVVIRDFLGINTSAFRPDTIVGIQRAIGLLSPFDDGTGVIRWRLLPRGGTDIVLQTKVADISVSVALDTVTASLGDTIELTVVVANAGPQAATQLQVRDTIPTALGFVSATSTAGSYSSTTGTWDVGRLPANASDTLKVTMEVVDGAPASINLVAESLGLTFEVDPAGGNNRAVVVLTIQ